MRLLRHVCFIVACLIISVTGVGVAQNGSVTADTGTERARSTGTPDGNSSEEQSSRAGSGGQSPSRETPKLVGTFVHAAAIAIEVAGVLIIGLSALITSGYFLWAKFKEKDAPSPYHQFRMNLGRGILLGLEFLVAGDIVGTVAVDPTFQNLGVLGLIVLIRTFLSFSLEVEIHGRWPWQGSKVESKYD